MKPVLLFFIFFFFSHLYSQLNELKGIWVSSELDCIAIRDITNKYDDSNTLGIADKDQSVNVFLYGDTLSFQKKYYTSESNFTKEMIDSFNLIIISSNEKYLTLKPISTLAKKFFNNRKKIKFIKQEINVDSSIKFEKIIYHTTGCYGSCPVIDIEINNQKQIYLNGTFYKDFTMFEVDTTLSGKYIGELSDLLYNELNDYLKTCSLKKLNFSENKSLEDPITTLILYYNGQRSYFKLGYTPAIIEKLIDFLFTLDQRASLKKTNEVRQLEK